MACHLAHGADPYWFDAMRKVNDAFDGNPGYVAQFGDSITYSMAFWNPISWMEPDEYLTKDDGLPKRPGDKQWRNALKGFSAKGPSQGNYSGWRVDSLLERVPEVLARENPEVALVMIGTNDTGSKGPPADFGPKLEALLTKILEAHCIPVLNTIPPKRGSEAGVELANGVIRELALKMKVPLVDYHAEILRRQPGESWFGTLISKDGTHPSGGEVGDFSEANLSTCGYALRTWMNFLVVRQLYFRILIKPKPFVEVIGEVEPIRQGIRCPVVADTQVSGYAGDGINERVWNWGASERLKIKGWEEYALFKFDVSACRGQSIKRATLYLSRTDQCVINVAGVSTISADWKEGKGTGKAAGGATFAHADAPSTAWGRSGQVFKDVVFGHGGSRWQAVKTGWAKDEQGQSYFSVELPPEIAHALLVEGDTYGLAVSEEKGQRQFQSTYRRVPNPNHFVYTRESKHPCFLVVEAEGKAPVRAPKAIEKPTAAPGDEAGGVVLSWTAPADADGRPVLGYRVHASKDRLDPRSLGAATLLPRNLTWRPEPPSRRQVFHVDGMEPGLEHHFAVVAYDRHGNVSAPAVFQGATRPAKDIRLAEVPAADPLGEPIEGSGLRVWACAPGEKVSPVTGNAMSEGGYSNAKPVGSFRKGNEVWSGARKAVVLDAGRNDFASFQLVLENTQPQPLVGLDIACSDLLPETPLTRTARLLMLSRTAPAAFQDAMADLGRTDPAAAADVFAALDRVHTLRAKQRTDAKAFFEEMEALRRRDASEYRKWTTLLAEGGTVAIPGGIAASNVELFWQWSVPGASDAWYPDALVPLDGAIEIPNVRNRVPGQRVQALQADVWVPHDTPPGRYRGDLRIRSAKGAETLVPVELTVWNFTLPDTLNFLCDMNGYGYPAFKDWDGVLELHRLAHRNRLNVNIVPYSHGGNWTVAQMELEASGIGARRRVTSFERFDRHFGPLLDGSAFARNPRAGVPVAAFYLGVHENWPCSLKEGFAFDQTAQHLDIRDDFTQDYKDGVVAVSRHLAEHLRGKGYDRTAFQVFLNDKYQYAPETTFWLLDEPMFRDDYLVIEMFGNLVREGFKDSGPAMVDYRIDCSRVEEARGMMNRVDTMVFSQSNVREYPDIAKAFMRSYDPKRPGEARKSWEYGGAGSVSDLPVGLRGWALDAWLSGRDGLLPWLAYGSDDAWSDAGKAQNAVFYPAWNKWSHNGCHGSLRMKAFRDGQQDAECLILLARKLGATRQELAAALRPYVTLVGDVRREGGSALAEDAGSMTYRGLTPDALARLRRTLCRNLGGEEVHNTQRGNQR